MANKCLNCSNRLEQTTGKKKRLFCDDKCRMAYKRANVEPPISEQTFKSEHFISEQIISEQPEIKSEQLKANKAIQGICHGCGKEVKDYICICYNCTHSGVTHKSLGLDISKCDY